MPGAGAPPDSSSPGGTWELQLAESTVCNLDTGATTTVHNLRLNYFCSDGGSLYGDPDTSTPTWTIRHQAKNAPNLEHVEIAAAYQ